MTTTYQILDVNKVVSVKTTGSVGLTGKTGGDKWMDQLWMSRCWGCDERSGAG